MSSMEKFFMWFNGLGGPTPRETEQIREKFIDKPKSSSLKSRAKEIKRKYNYKFKKDFLKDVPDINKLYFDKK